MPTKHQERAKTSHEGIEPLETATTSTTKSSGAESSSNPKGLPPRSKSTTIKGGKTHAKLRRTTAAATQLYSPGGAENLTEKFNRLSVTANPPARPISRAQSSRAPSGPSNGRIKSASTVPRQCKTVEDIARVIMSESTKNVVVMVGAGLSTPSGIPDFRSPGTGLYDNLRQYRVPVPQAIFDIDYFETKPKPFYTLAKELYPSGKYRPNYAHYFIRLLHEKGLLLRVYTQNIDGLERLAGIPPMKIVEAHGTFLTSACIRCSQSHPSETVKQAVFNDKIPRCSKTNGCNGLVKPNIVFFGEDLPRRFYYYLKDFPQADLLLVMGTSLEVEPFAGIVNAVRFFIPRMLFNREAVGPFRGKHRANDVVAKGDLIRQIRRFVTMLGWSDDMNELIETEERKKGYPVPIYEEHDDEHEENTPGPSGRANKSNSSSKSIPRSSSTPTYPDTKNKVPNSNNAVTQWGVRRTGLTRTRKPSPSPKVNRSATSTNTNVPTTTTTNNHTNQQRAEITAIKNMVKLNNGGLMQKSASTSSMFPKILGTRTTAKNATGTGGGTTRPKAFHAQKTLFRTHDEKAEEERRKQEAEVFLYTNCGGSEEVESSSSGEEESSSDDDDDDDDDA